MLQEGLIEAGELVFIVTGYIAVGLMVLVKVCCVLNDYFGSEASETELGCFGGA